MKFEIKDRDAGGRLCKFTTKHGVVTTPNLLPVINPNKMIITPNEMKELFGTEMVITNSYIINKDEKLREKALKKGVHNLIGFHGPIMTDSGTFQSYIYGDINLDPLEIVEFQRNIKSDVGTILDVFGKPDQSKTKAEKGVKETIKRAKQSMKIKGDMILACTVQGSIYPELREKCARELSNLNADFFPIGGVVPLMENQRYAELVQCIIASKKGLNPSKPVHLFGAGHPLVFPLAVALGCDFFDSSAYAKYANDKRMIFSWGTIKLEDLDELPCCCPICTNYSVSDLKKIDENEMISALAKHNLFVSFTEIRRIRTAIIEGSLWELVEERASSNPYLQDALFELRKKENKKWLEPFEPVSKNKALFYTGNHTIHRPIIYRCHNRLNKRYNSFYDTSIIFPEGTKPYSKYYKNDIDLNLGLNFIVDSHIGPVPFELDEMYPFAQNVFSKNVDKETKEELSKVFGTFTKGKQIIHWMGKKTLNELPKITDKDLINIDLKRISAVVDMQFGTNTSKILIEGTVNIIKSKKTGKIRNIYTNNEHILSMRASDGLFTLKIQGGNKLHKSLKYPKLRVVVDKDAASFVKEGKSVFAKFVKDCDSELRPFDECLIVDKKDNLLAVGRCLLNRNEMLSFDSGVAVKTREVNS
jgi:7-cyano-7-deazaguanine tRNA-ribosyltransferase